MRFKLWLVLFVLGQGGFYVPGHAQTVQDIRVGLHGNATHLVIEADQAFAYRIFSLRNPDRLIIDMPRMQWQGLTLPHIGQSSLIKQSRHGLFRPNVTRLVLDLSSAITLQQHSQYVNLLGSHVLLVEFTPSLDMQADLAERDWKEYLSADQPPKSEPPATAHKNIPTPLPRNRPQFVVMIDPGHGGIDPGAVRQDGHIQVFEKDIVLNVGKKLRDALKQQQVNALMTRNDDYYLPLTERFRKAEDHGAKLFISLHADAAESLAATGASLYTLSDKASDREAAKLAQRENAADIRVGVSTLDNYEPAVQVILLSMRQRATQTLSTTLVELLLPPLAKATQLKPHPHRSAGFAVLKSPVVPSVLVELGYLSNEQDRRKLQDSAYQQQLADALAQGVMAFLQQQS